jgi:hypothetical protein
MPSLICGDLLREHTIFFCHEKPLLGIYMLETFHLGLLRV